MGLGGISIWQLLIILLIVVMIFGTKRLKNIGSDLGGAVKGFKQSMSEDTPDDNEKQDPENLDAPGPDSNTAKNKTETENKN